MLEKAADEIDGVEGAPLDDARTAVAVAERDVTVVEAFEAAVDDRDAKDVARQIVEDLFPGPGVLDVDDPLLAPDRGRRLIEEAGLAEARANLGAEEAGQRPPGDQERRVLGRHPGPVGAAQPAGGDEHVHVGMVEQRARLGVEHGEHPGTRPEVARIGGELEERGGGRRHEQAVDEFLVRPD